MEQNHIKLTSSSERHTNIEIEVPNGERQLLLHCCCAPCSGAIVECLQERGITPVLFFSNSNIYPYSEYEHRRAECERWAAARGVVFVEDEYDHACWRAATAGLENEPERRRRCEICFRFRLLRAAQYAAKNGLRVLTTTLASSRWKNLEQVNAAGEDACRMVNSEIFDQTSSTMNRTVFAGTLQLNDSPHESNMDVEVLWWGQNWRKGGLQQRRSEIIREQNFYNQMYCGCEFSMPKDKDSATAAVVESEDKGE